MPFTLAHPAAILPLYRWSKSRLPLSALIVGSMSPDFAYFVPERLGATSHSVAGIFYFCWPTGLAVWVIFQFVLKQPTIALMPHALRARMSSSATRLNPLLLSLASIAIVIGAVTHVIWDSFTHATSPLVVVFPRLQVAVVNIGGQPLHVYKLLQHASTIMGLMVMTFWAFRFWKRSRQHSLPIEGQAYSMPSHTLSTTWRIAAIAAIFVSSCTGATIDYVFHSHGALERRLFFVAIGGMTGCALAWCAIAIVITRKWHAARVGSLTSCD